MGFKPQIDQLGLPKSGTKLKTRKKAAHQNLARALKSPEIAAGIGRQKDKFQVTGFQLCLHLRLAKHGNPRAARKTQKGQAAFMHESGNLVGEIGPNLDL